MFILRSTEPVFFLIIKQKIQDFFAAFNTVKIRKNEELNDKSIIERGYSIAEPLLSESTRQRLVSNTHVSLNPSFLRLSNLLDDAESCNGGSERRSLSKTVISSSIITKDGFQEKECNELKQLLLSKEPKEINLKPAKEKMELQPLLVFLQSSFNIELVFIILKSITQFSYL